ncbi:hypothetical protein L3Q82_016463, partial [Scortum barcoo]
WCVFKDTDINTYTDAVIGYIGKCIDDVVPRITVQTFPNQKPWVNGEVCAKLKAQTDAYNSGVGFGGVQEVQHFNTIVPSKLVTKLRDLGLNSALCDWILNFLTGRPQAVRMGSTTSSTLTLNTGAPQGYLLMTQLSLRPDHHDDETAYREVRGQSPDILVPGQQPPSQRVSKTKELIVDFRRRQREEHVPLNGTTVERVNSFRFLGVHISEDLTWTHHTDFITKSARQRLFFLHAGCGGSTWTQGYSAGSTGDPQRGP